MKIKKIRISFSFFYMGYILYFIGLYLDDLPVSFGSAGKLIKYLSYMIFVISLTNHSLKQKNAVIAVTALVFSAAIGIFTRDFYFSFLVIILISSTCYDSYKIFKISFFLLLLLSAATVAASFAGILPNLNTMNRNYSERYSLGFYHSNVLPMVLYYLLAYRMILKESSMKIKELILWVLAALIIFTQCKSRNGLVSVFLLTSGFLLYRKRSKCKILYFFSKFSVAFIAPLLLALSLMQGHYRRSMYIINQLFTGRLGKAYLQIRTSGLHIINLMEKNQYAYDAFVLDSGYLYTMIRYGLIFILPYIFFQYICAKKNKRHPIILVVILVNSFANTIDNDLFSYNMLPFIILSISKLTSKFTLNPDAILNYIKDYFKSYKLKRR